jgi:RNA polymerase sigma-70 factor (TIGR02943 family)
MNEKELDGQHSPNVVEQPGLPDPAIWVDEYGDYLFRYAILRERDRQLAEDLVQETFLAALRARDSFRGDSSPQTWLIGILKRKLIDRLRGQQRRSLNEAGEVDIAQTLFNRHGKWRSDPGRWVRPETNLQRQEFWEALYRCLSRLPKRMSAAFRLREVEQLESEKVCATLEVSSGNLNVLLHRARLGLSHCLGLDWLAHCGKD